jgi:UDP-N-acetylmuramyl pentapeptide phosphotransferase/UDP-N-acetylglucosamine-1-phosphate transferase
VALEGKLALATGIAFATTFALTPAAIRVAASTGFLDRPRGYRAHARPTPYLGGTAVVAGWLVSAAAFAGGGRLVGIGAGAAAFCLIGTVDDHRALSPLWRLAAAGGAGAALWATGLGWSVGGPEFIALLLSVGWVACVTTAFNLLDNIDGAAAGTAAVSAAGVGTLGQALAHESAV